MVIVDDSTVLPVVRVGFGVIGGVALGLVLMATVAVV